MTPCPTILAVQLTRTLLVFPLLGLLSSCTPERPTPQTTSPPASPPSPPPASGGERAQPPPSEPQRPAVEPPVGASPAELLTSAYGALPLCLHFKVSRNSSKFEARAEIDANGHVHLITHKVRTPETGTCSYAGPLAALQAKCELSATPLEPFVWSRALSFAQPQTFAVQELRAPVTQQPHLDGPSSLWWYQGKVTLPTDPSGVREAEIIFAQDPSTRLVEAIQIGYNGWYSFSFRVIEQAFAPCPRTDSRKLSR